MTAAPNLTWTDRPFLRAEVPRGDNRGKVLTNAVPHPNDFVYDANPHLAGPYVTEDGAEWAYADQDMLQAEPYLIMEAIHGQSLGAVLEKAPGKRLPESRAIRIMVQVAAVLQV